jgi:hypothetical protein
MGLHVAALDIAPGKVALARTAGSDIAVDGRSPDAVADILKATGSGAHGVLVTAVSPPAFSQALRGASQGDHRPCRSATRGVSHPDLRCCSEAYYHARLHRRNASRPRRGNRICCRGQGAGRDQDCPIERRPRLAKRSPRRRSSRPGLRSGLRNDRPRPSERRFKADVPGSGKRCRLS